MRYRRRLLKVLIIWLAAGPTARTGAAADSFRPPALSVENVPDVPRELVERLQQYQSVRWAAFRGWSPDGKGMLIQTRFGNTAQLHRVLDPGGRREQWTFFLEPTDGRFLLPQQRGNDGDGGALLVTMSSRGDENFQIYRFDRGSGGATLLTDGRSRNLLGPVRDDGSLLVFASNRRNGRDTDLFTLDPRRPDSARTILQKDGEYWTAEDWSPDGKRLLISRYVSIHESYPAVLDVETGRLDALVLSEEPAAYGPMAFTHDGRHVLLASDFASEFRQLYRVELTSAERPRAVPLTQDIPWDVTDIEVDRAGGQAALATNEDGGSGLYLLADGQPRRVEIPLGIVSGLEFTPDGRTLGFTLQRPDAPGDAYSLSVEGGQLVRWTYSEIGGLNPAAFVQPERIAFPSFDGRQIPAYYFRPPAATKDKPAAVLIHIHGGPEGQYRPSFSGTDQFHLLEQGIAVIRPNVRGSSGYGKTYLRLDNAERREDSVRDIGALLDWIARQPELDSQRVAVIGASYGGYMVLSSLVHYSDRLRAGVDIVGIASFETFLKNTSPYRQDLRRAEYGDERDPRMLAVFRRIDPLNNADRIRTALLVAHGRNDPRVPFSEAEQIAPKVRNNGQTVWTVYADDEGHGFQKQANRDYLTAVIAMFLEQRLK